MSSICALTLRLHIHLRFLIFHGLLTLSHPLVFTLFCYEMKLTFCHAVQKASMEVFSLLIHLCITASNKWKEMSSISKSPPSSNIAGFVDCMQACAFRLAGFIFSTCFEVVSGCKAQTGCRLDWDSNCHFESDKVLICLPGTERLDITVDKWAVEQNWQDAREDKMPSGRVFFSMCYHSWTTAS